MHAKRIEVTKDRVMKVSVAKRFSRRWESRNRVTRVV